MKMYLDVHSLGGVSHHWRGVNSHEGYQMPRKLTFFSLSLLDEVGAQLLVVDLRVVSKPSQTFTGQITSRKPPGDPSRLGFPTNPRVTSNLNELKGELNIAWWRCSSGPPLSFYQRDLDFGG
jgi:hypothetical protein